MPESPHEFYAALVSCFEHPHSEWRRKPKSELSEAAFTVRLGMELLARIDRLGWNSDIRDVVDRLFQMSLDEVRSFGVALQRLGANRMRRRLGVLVRHLRFPDDERSVDSVIAIGKAASRLGLSRVWGAILSNQLELESSLWRFIREHGLERGLLFAHVDRAAWRTVHYGRPVPTRPNPSDARIVVMRWGSGEALQLIDAWLERKGGASHFGPHGAVTIKRVDGLAPSRRESWHHNMPNDRGIGVLLPGQPPPSLSVEQLIQEPERYVAGLLSRFEWVFVPMMNVGKVSMFCFVSPHPHLQHSFLHFVLESPFRSLLVGFHADPQVLGSKAQGAAFRETDLYGQAALIAAEADGVAPLLAAKFTPSAGYWWVELTQQCECLAIRRSSELYGATVTAVYRAPKRDVFLQLWSRIGSDSNIAFLSVSGYSDPERVVDYMVLSSQLDDVENASREFGWAYRHIWGGGADEHSALFHCQEAAVTQQVYHYAASRVADGWWLAGRWSTAIKLSDGRQIDEHGAIAESKTP